MTQRDGEDNPRQPARSRGEKDGPEGKGAPVPIMMKAGNVAKTKLIAAEAEA